MLEGVRYLRLLPAPARTPTTISSLLLSLGNRRQRLRRRTRAGEGSGSFFKVGCTFFLQPLLGMERRCTLSSCLARCYQTRRTLPRLSKRGRHSRGSLCVWTRTRLLLTSHRTLSHVAGCTVCLKLSTRKVSAQRRNLRAYAGRNGQRTSDVSSTSQRTSTLQLLKLSLDAGLRRRV